MAANGVTGGRLRTVRDALGPGEWARVGAMGAVVVGLYVLGFGMLGAAIPHHYRLSGSATFGLGTGILALTLGMRHAFDADHIAAIDNTTRKLMAEGKRPLSVGFFFSLGHSTVVFALSILLNFGIRSLDKQVSNGGSGLHNVTGDHRDVGVGDLPLSDRRTEHRHPRLHRPGLPRSAAGQVRRRGARGATEQTGTDEPVLRSPGPADRQPLEDLSRRRSSSVSGFDTATEVALLVLSGTAVASGLPFYAILSLPVLFAAGMSLLDTIDGCFMNFAYGWAFARPIRKIYYNITITGPLGGGGLRHRDHRVPGAVAARSSTGAGASGTSSRTSTSTAPASPSSVLFVVTWAVALSIWRFGRIEERWDAAAAGRPG